jgi:hypothetical protein
MRNCRGHPVLCVGASADAGTDAAARPPMCDGDAAMRTDAAVTLPQPAIVLRFGDTSSAVPKLELMLEFAMMFSVSLGCGVIRSALMLRLAMIPLRLFLWRISTRRCGQFFRFGFAFLLFSPHACTLYPPLQPPPSYI